MNAFPLALTGVLLTAAFFSPTTWAYADGPKPIPYDPPTTVVTESMGHPYLDCTEGVWFVVVTLRTYEETAPDVYASPAITTRVDVWNTATGDSPDADCPNWILNEDDGTWSNSDVIWKVGLKTT